MKRCKSIDELYEEVKEFDLVITNDAALATALNGRIDFPIIGHFALTPKQIASKVATRIIGTPLYSELKVISTISDETGIGMKYVHSELENIKEIRKYTPNVKNYLFTKASRKVYDSYEPIPTLERVMGSFIPEDDEFYKREKVAVIADELFNDLDKHFIPIDYSPISIFTDDEYRIDTIYEIGNDRQLAQNAVDLIDIDRPSDYAFVLNTASPITDALRSALYRKNIPFINSLNVRDLSQIRDYLRFITLALDFDTIRVKHVKELFANYNGAFFKGKEEFLLCKQTESDMTERALELWRTMRDIRKLSFGEVCDIVCNRRTKVQVNNLINELDVQNRMINTELLNDVKYAVDNVKELTHNEEIPDNERSGVLIVDCNNSIYIDRPVVIYLGMEQDWNRSVVGKRYLDVQDETDRNVMKLNALIQQGDVRFYFVNATKGGKPARPSLLFDLLFKKPIESFSEMCDKIVKGRWHSSQNASMPMKEPVYGTDRKAFSGPFSKSSFNAYYSCPRKFLYSKLLSTPEEKGSEFGTLIHAFAEFYICYPDDVKRFGVDHFVNLISDEYSGLSSPMMEKLDADRIKKAMTSIIRYLDYLGVRDFPLDTPVDMKNHPNRFMIAMGKKLTSSLCEREIVSEDHPVYGQLDLTWNGVISDYKTGKPHTGVEIAESMTIDSGAKYPEFQVPIYLTLMKEDDRSQGRFDLFYAMDNDTASGDESPISDNVRTIRLSEMSLKECITRDPKVRDILSMTLSKKLKDHTDEILAIIDEMGSEDPNDWDKDEAMINRIADIVGLKISNKDTKSTIERGLRKIAKFSKDGLVVIDDTINVPMSTLESTINTIDSMHAQMVEQSLVEFPPAPRIDCKNCQYRSVCTKDVILSAGDSNE